MMETYETITAAFRTAWNAKFEADIRIASMNDSPGRKPWELQSDAAKITIDALMDAYGPHLSNEVRYAVAVGFADQFRELKLHGFA